MSDHQYEFDFIFFKPWFDVIYSAAASVSSNPGQQGGQEQKRKLGNQVSQNVRVTSSMSVVFTFSIPNQLVCPVASISSTIPPIPPIPPSYQSVMLKLKF